MDNQRLFLWTGLAVLVFLNFQAWQHDYAPAPETPAARTTTPAPAAPAAASSLSESLPGVAAPSAAVAPERPPQPAVDTAGPRSASVIHVRSDVLDLTVSTEGGEIREATLRRYPRLKDKPNELLSLLAVDGPDAPSVFQWGLTAGGAAAEPNHKALFSAAATDYELKDGERELTVPMTWNDGAGLSVTRSIRLTRGSYAIDLNQHAANAGAAPWRGRSYSQLLRHWERAERSMWNPETSSFKGPAIYDGHRYQKLDVEKPDPDLLPKGPITGGWAAALQHHFVAAMIPDPALPSEYSLAVKDKEFQLRVAGPVQEVAAGGAVDFKQKLFVGPKLQEELAATAPELDRTADYGRLTILARPLFWLLSQVHRVVGNWGFTIIIVTFVIKLCFYPLAQTSGRSMARMRTIAPRMKAIQERHKDDREQLGKQMMELYKREKVNPLAGCLPIVVQIPVFIAFYWVLLESVEMRQAPFLLWVQDLSTRDPYFVLPAIMGVAMFGQFKLNPAPPDPVQAKVFAFMPLVMTVMMAFFPAGLVLYWITNTALSIAQQWRINQLVAAEDQKGRA